MTQAPTPSSRLLEHLGGERLLWSGRPDPRVLLGPFDALIIPVTLLWAGFVVFWNVGVWRLHGAAWMRLWGLPFLLVGGYALIGRFVVKRRHKQGLEYGLTARRAIIVDRRGNVTDVPLAGLAIRSRRSRTGRHLTVSFGSGLMASRFSGVARPRPPGNYGFDFLPATPPGFYDVSDVDRLERALRAVER